MALLVVLWMIGDPEPIWVSLGDKPIDLVVKATDGTSYQLDDLVDSSFCFFLTADCAPCLEALENIDRYLFDRYHCLLILRGKRAEDWREVVPARMWPNVFLADDEQALAGYNIKTFPALLAYKGSKLKMASHGPMDAATCRRIASIYDRGGIKRGSEIKN